MKKVAAVIFLSTFSLGASAESAHLIWKGDPLVINLAPDLERRVVFPDSVTVDVKNALTTDQIKLLNNDGSLYLTALKPFSKSRIFVTQKSTGKVMLVDLVTDKLASNKKVTIDIPDDHQADENRHHAGANIIEMIRFAWQQFYAPARLIDANASMTAVPVRTDRFVSGLVRGDKIIASPAGSWYSGDRYVTAVIVRNKLSHHVFINLAKDICGAFQAATLYPRTVLKAAGRKQLDTTMLFLVSTKTFGDSLCHGNAQNK